MKILFIVLLVLGLAGCGTHPQTQNLIRTELLVVDVPSSLFNCPGVPGMPAAATLTDRQISDLLIRLTRNNTTCQNSINAIRQYLEEAKAEIQTHDDESRRN